MPQRAELFSEQRDKVEDILSQIWEFSASEKSRFMRKFVKRTATRNASEMSFLRSLVLAVPVGSNLDKLPTELVSQVLGHVETRTLARLAQTCKKLSATILNDYRPWRSLYLREVDSSRISQITQAFQSQVAKSIASSTAKYHLPPSTYSASLPYTAALFYEQRLQSNWSKVRPGERPVGFDCHGSHVVTCMEIDPLGRYFLTGSDDGTVRLWSTDSSYNTVSPEQRELCVYSGHLGGVWALKVDWERGILVTGSTDRTLIVWDLHSGERMRHLLGHTSTVRCVELIDDVIISGSRDGTLRVWNLSTGECLHVLQGHTASVRCISLGPTGIINSSGNGMTMTVVSGSYDSTCRLWDLSTGECLVVFEGHGSKVYAVTCTRDQIYSGSLDGTVRAWDPDSGECLKVFEGHRSLVGLVQAKDPVMPETVITGSTDGSLQVIKTNNNINYNYNMNYNNSNHSNYSNQSFDSALLPSAHPSSITSMDFNRNFLVTGSEGVVRLWSLESGKVEPCLLANLIENLDMVWRVSVTDNLALIAYQIQGQTRVAIFNFAPPPQQILIEMRSFRSIIPQEGHDENNVLNSLSTKDGNDKNKKTHGNTNTNNNDIDNNQYTMFQDIRPTPTSSTISSSYSSHQIQPHIQAPSTLSHHQHQHQQQQHCESTPTIHPELLVLGLASQSIVDLQQYEDDVIFTD